MCVETVVVFLIKQNIIIFMITLSNEVRFEQFFSLLHLMITAKEAEANAAISPHIRCHTTQNCIEVALFYLVRGCIKLLSGSEMTSS